MHDCLAHHGSINFTATRSKISLDFKEKYSSTNHVNTIIAEIRGKIYVASFLPQASFKKKCSFIALLFKLWIKDHLH